MANSTFLDAWLGHGSWQRLVAVVANQGSADSLLARLRRNPRVVREQPPLDIVPLARFHERFFPRPPASVLHFPQPVEPELAWVRHHKQPHSFSLSGVTHTISLKEVMERFMSLVSGPFESYDTLFCISQASLRVVRTVIDNYAAFLKERFGGEPRARIRLESVPFGVDAQRFRPASPTDRAAARAALGVAPDALCVLFVGRLSYASKVHPFAIYRAVAEAARRTGRSVHLVLAGWSETPSIFEKFTEGARAFAANVQTTFVDGMRADSRFAVWNAADVFLSLSDNIQETLGLTILEAQACGLPVVTTDWDGCRESVVDGTTGFLVPTYLVQGATSDGTSRHLLSETTHGSFLGETNQAVAVDVRATTQALERLFTDAPLRASMGAAGRERVLSEFNWARVIARYEEVWREQEQVRAEHASRAQASTVRTPVPFPDVEHTFGSYPSETLTLDALVVSSDDAGARLGQLLSSSLTNYRPGARIVEPAVLLELLERAHEASSLGSLDALLDAGGRVPVQRRRATLAWLLKYDLLRRWGGPAEEPLA